MFQSQNAEPSHYAIGTIYLLQLQSTTMGNTQPTNQTGKKVVAQKLQHAKKTGVLSLAEHKLEACPAKVFELTNLRTLDLSSNALTALNPNIANLKNLKSLNLESNKLPPGSLNPIGRLSNLQNLNCGENLLQKPTSENPSITMNAEPLPANLPKGLKQLRMHRNFLSSVPKPILSATLVKLDKLDLSNNDIAAIPEGISNLINLTELNMDFNSIVNLPQSIGLLAKLKVLSLKSNHISVHSTQWSDKNPQPLPEELFNNTPLIDLNLHGNPMTSTQLNSMNGYEKFLERRQKVKTSALLGGALTNFDVCGLE
jgi:Leucine-rich repeat (LRR) protein